MRGAGAVSHELLRDDPGRPPISPEHLTLYVASIRFDVRSDEGI